MKGHLKFFHDCNSLNNQYTNSKTKYYSVQKKTPKDAWGALTLFLERSGITVPREGGSICPPYTVVCD